MHLKRNMAVEFKQTLDTTVLPLLRRQQGFQDEVVLIAADGREAVGISFWDSQRNAEAYAEQSYVDVRRLLSKVTDGTPIVRSYEVSISTFDKTGAKGAASSST
jgi:hypothetical protein